MKQKLKRFMAGFMAMLTLVGTLFTNGTTAFAASPQANIAFWNASVKNSGEVSELKPGYNHGKILYSILDGNSAYCMNFGLRADGGQLMNSYDDASTSMSAQQRKLLSYCLYYGFNSTQKAAPSNSQCDEYIATQAMVWVIVADIFGTGSGDSAARKLCNTAPSPDSSYSYYERLRDNISSSYNATLPSFASRRTSEAPTYELKWNEGSQRFETTLSDSNGVLSDFDFGISGYSVDKNGNSITISSTSVNTTATTGTFTSNAGKVETTSSCVFWLTGKSGYQEFISERPTADPVKAYIKVKTENIGYGELTKTDESSGVKLSGAVYGIYSDSGCTNRVVFGDSFKITNIAILENKDKGELFVSMPRYRSNERDESNGVIYKDVCNPITAEFREELYTNILDAYARIKEPEKEETQKQERTQEMPEFSVTVTPYEREGSNIKGLARIYFENSFIVNNINIVQGKEKIFVSMPSYKTKQVDEQGKPIYQDVCYPVTKDFREKLYNEIISEYEKAKDKSNEKARESAEKHHGNPDKEKDKEATPFR